MKPFLETIGKVLGQQPTARLPADVFPQKDRQLVVKLNCLSQK